tara:strand:- start:1638 stop:1970 length:333 start_codon:yes stop_codon:yes gene_type:complete
MSMAYEIEYYTDEEDGWRVQFDDEFVIKKVEFARIVSDSMDEIGLAIDEIDARWPGGPVNDDWSEIKSTCGGLELLPGPDGGKIARQLSSGFLPTRVRGRWQVFWGRILW